MAAENEPPSRHGHQLPLGRRTGGRFVWTSSHPNTAAGVTFRPMRSSVAGLGNKEDAMKSALSATLAAATLLTGTAAAQGGETVTEMTREDIVSLVEANGRTVVNQNEEMPPAVIVENEGGFQYAVVGAACGDDTTCGGLKLAWQVQAQPPPLGFINAVNMEIPPLKIWADPQGVSIERYLILDPGVSVDLITYEMDVFEQLVPVAAQRMQELIAQANAQAEQQGEGGQQGQGGAQPQQPQQPPQQ